MTRITFQELQEFILKAADLLEEAIKFSISFEEFNERLKNLIPEGNYYYEEDDRDRLIRDIIRSIKLKRIVMEYPLTTCLRYKNKVMARYLLEMMEEDK